MDFPASAITETGSFPELTSLFSDAPRRTCRARTDLLVELGSEQSVRAFQPDFAAIGRLPCRGLIITARSESSDYDFISRFFAPSVGVDEDPVTGSAHCALGPYWSAKLGRNTLTGYQASKRGGVVGVETSGDRVLLSGQAVTVIRGELFA
jgi:predicted PhzF superfamily epimerase YddE/YHI9